MGPHKKGPHAILICQGVTTLCVERYKDRKLWFKNMWFRVREGYELPQEIRQFPPTDMPFEEWNKYVDFILDNKNTRRSAANSENRRKQKYASVYGTWLYNAIRHDFRDPVSGQFPNLITHFGNMHR